MKKVSSSSKMLTCDRGWVHYYELESKKPSKPAHLSNKSHSPSINRESCVDDIWIRWISGFLRLSRKMAMQLNKVKLAIKEKIAWISEESRRGGEVWFFSKATYILTLFNYPWNHQQSALQPKSGLCDFYLFGPLQEAFLEKKYYIFIFIWTN